MKTFALLRAGLLVGLLIAAFLATSCSTPTTTALAGKAKVSVSVGKAASRTVLPDLTGLQNSVDSYVITLTSHEGFDTLSQEVNAPSTAITFDSVTTGTWDVLVTAYDGGIAVGTGHLDNQVLSTRDTSATWEVWVGLNLTQSGQGSFALTITYPTSVGVTSFSTELLDVENNLVASSAIGTSDGTTDTQVVSSDGSIPSGAYTLKLTWSRNDIVVATRWESVNIWDGQVSDQWAGNGGLYSQLELTEGDFAPGDSSLASLVLTDANSAAVATTGAFDPSTLYYEVDSTPNIRFDVTFRPGQMIEFSYRDVVNGPDSAWYQVSDYPHGNGDHTLSDAGRWIKFRVTAADGTQTIYTVTGPSNG